MSEVMIQGLWLSAYGLATVFASLILCAGMVKLMQVTMVDAPVPDEDSE